MKKTIAGKQFNIVFHVDKLKIFHMYPAVFTSIIEDISNRYENIMPLSISRGKVHEYLGIVFDYTNVGYVKITMYQYLEGVIKHAPKIYKSGRISSTPAPIHLYKLRDPNNEYTELLNQSEKKAHHKVTA